MRSQQGQRHSSRQAMGARIRHRLAAIAMVLGLLFSADAPAHAYSLLTHEQLIDLTWQSSIEPLLLSQYPNLTPEQLQEARAYAYGGCVIQDIGYYPFGSRSFSNLTHYVRSGDFVVNLFRNASNANELAFAVGALSHYVGDTLGHSLATNLAVPVEFPRLRRRYGRLVNYAQGPDAHVQTEFAFDIDEVVHHHVAPVRYLRHIGLRVPVRQLALAYYQTYGLAEDFSVVKGHRFNLPGYRFATRAFIPRIAYAITVLRRDDEPPEPDTAEAREIAREAAEVARMNNWDYYRRKPGIGTYTLAGLLWILPKVGPLKMVAVKGPTVATEAEYNHSVAMSITVLRRLLVRFTPPSPQEPAVVTPAALQLSVDDPAAYADLLLHSRNPDHPLPNRDLDTGHVVRPGGYPLTDATYASLLHRLTRHPLRPIPPGIKIDIEAYYADANAPITTKQDPRHWKQVQADLWTLRGMLTSNEPQPYPTYGDDLGDDD